MSWMNGFQEDGLNGIPAIVQRSHAESLLIGGVSQRSLYIPFILLSCLKNRKC